MAEQNPAGTSSTMVKTTDLIGIMEESQGERHQRQRQQEAIPENDELGELLAIALHLLEPFREDVLACALQISRDAVADRMRLALEHGILVKDTQTSKEDDASSSYRFASEETRQRVEQRVLSEDHDASESSRIHQQIGRRLLREGLDKTLAIQHLRLGMMEDTAAMQKASSETCQHLAKISLNAGTTCARTSNFRQAAEILDFGIALLEVASASPTRHWRDHYDLSLAVYQASAEAHSAHSNYDLALQRIQVVKTNARNFHDTITVCATEVYIYGMRAERDRGIDTGIAVLAQLGVKINPHPRQWHMMRADWKLRSLLRGKSCEGILRMPEMTDENAIAAMQMLNLIFNMVFSTRSQLLPLVVLNMVGLTLENGLSVMSSVGFAMYAMMLASFGQVDRGASYAQLALDIYARFPVKEWLPRIYAGLYGGVYACIQSPAVSVQHLMHGYEVGMQSGDIEFALVDNHLHAFSAFGVGWKLDKIERQLAALFQESIELKQVWIQRLSGAFLQFVQNLMGLSPDPTRLVGTFNENVVDVESLDTLSLQFWPWYRMMLCCLFQEYTRAAQESKLCRGVELFPNGNPVFAYAAVFHSLSAIGLYRQTGRGRWRAIRETQRQAKFVKSKALLVPSVCSCKHFLLKAELAWLQGKHRVVLYMYNNSISCAKGNGLPFDEALAHERFARYNLEHSRDLEKASQSFGQAVELYRSWGAVAKANQLQEELHRLLVKHPSSSNKTATLTTNERNTSDETKSSQSEN